MAILGAFLLGIMRGSTASLPPMLDVLVSYWRIHITYRQESMFLTSAFQLLGLPLTFTSNDEFMAILGTASAMALGLGTRHARRSQAGGNYRNRGLGYRVFDAINDSA